MNAFFRRLKWLLQRRSKNAELRDELQFHLDEEADERLAEGLAAQIDSALARERLLAFLSTLMALITVTLAAVGLYGVLSFSVVRRTREIGIRIAVGAERRQILRLFLNENMRVVLGGVALGVPLAFLSGRLAASMLYGLKPQDTATAIAATALLALVALTATAIPAWRAARVEPMAALKHE